MNTITCEFVGAPLRFTFRRNGLPLDVSSATTLTIRIYRPNRTTVDLSASLVSGLTDTIEALTTAATTQDGSGTVLPGVYRYRARVVDTTLGLDGWTHEEGMFNAEAVL